MEYEEEVKFKYNELNPIKQGKIAKPYLILLDGTTGSGKSNVIKFISTFLDVEVLSNDKIRNFLALENPEISFEQREKIVKEIQYPRIKEALDKKIFVYWMEI